MGPTPPSTAETKDGRNARSVEQIATPSAEGVSVESFDSGGSSATRGVDPDGGGKEPQPFVPDPLDPGEPVDGPTYTWHNGDGTLQVTLQPELTVGGDGSVIARTEVAGSGGKVGNIPQGEGSTDRQTRGLPVFRSPSGALMTLPGGVLLSLDPGWDHSETDGFFATNGIAMDRVSELDWLPNGFLIETEPGFPSLDLANALSGQEGVEFSSPNWWTELTTR